MADIKKICEEVEIAILSDTELTVEQKKHLETCEECKALLSQASLMKQNLGSLSVPGLENGQITEKVMNSINKQKTWAPFPKFKITHHLGSAAAVVIILAAALVIKNPSLQMSDLAELDNTSAAESTQRKQIMHTISGAPTDDAADNNDMGAVIFSEAESGELSQEYAAYSDGTQLYDDIDNGKSDTIPETANLNFASSRYSLTDEPAKESSDSQEAVENYSYLSDDIYDNTEEKLEFSSVMPMEQDKTETASDTDTATKKMPTEKALYEEADGELAEEETENLTLAMLGASGGGGSAAAAYQSANPQDNVKEFKIILPALPLNHDGSSMDSAFDGIEFSESEDDFDYNIALANTRIYELFGIENRFTRQELEEMGCICNAQFLEFLNSNIIYSKK